MRIHIQGNEVRDIRVALGFGVGQFASLLGVHATTVSRWEGARGQRVPVDGIPATVLARLHYRIDNKPIPAVEVREKGSEIADLLIAAGALVALGVLIAWITRDE